MLKESYLSLRHAVDLYRGEHQTIFGVRTTGFFNVVGALLTDVAGQDFPKLEIWNDANAALVGAEQTLIGRNVQAAADQLQKANDAYKTASEEWGKYKAQLEGAAFKAQVGVAVVAVVTIVALGAVAVEGAAAVVGGGAGAVGGGASAAGGGAAALGGAATIPVDVVAAGGAATVPAGVGGAAALGGAATIPVDVVAAGGAATVPALAGGAGVAADVAATSAAGGAATIGGGAAAGDAIAEALVREASSALATGGEAAATQVAQAASASFLEAAMARISPVLIANYPFTSKEIEALGRLFDILNEVWKRKVGLPGIPP